MITQFIYRITGTGWAEVRFVNNLSYVFFETSYIGHALEDLITGLISLLKGSEQALEVVFPEEPGEHSLLIKKNGNNLLVEIYSSEEWREIAKAHQRPHAKKLLYQDNDSIENFCQIVYQGIKEMESRLTHNEYRKQWVRREFPKADFEKLKSLIK